MGELAAAALLGGGERRADERRIEPDPERSLHVRAELRVLVERREHRDGHRLALREAEERPAEHLPVRVLEHEAREVGVEPRELPLHLRGVRAVDGAEYLLAARR